MAPRSRIEFSQSTSISSLGFKYLNIETKKYWHLISISISWVLDIQLNAIPSLPIALWLEPMWVAREKRCLPDVVEATE
jgi:hypothetical protein